MAPLSPVVLDLIRLGIAVAPQILAAAQLELQLLNSGTTASAEQQATISAALDAAHATLQAAQQGAAPTI
jgi:hypothetical protein